MPILRDVAPKPSRPSPTGPSAQIRLSDAGGLTQFGCFVHLLPPGSATSLKHWHEKEDEMVYLLSGRMLLIEGERETPMHPGDSATFRAGTPLGHCLRNPGPEDARLLVIGTRVTADRITYPDHDVVLTYDDAAGVEEFRDSAGNPTISAYLKPPVEK